MPRKSRCPHPGKHRLQPVWRVVFGLRFEVCIDAEVTDVDAWPHHYDTSLMEKPPAISSDANP